MAKSANLYVRIEPDVKEQAEEILNALGLSASGAINLFYQQIILNRGLPFAVRLPEPKAADELSQAELDAMLAHSYQQSLAGEGRPYQEVFDALKKGISAT